MGIRHSPMLLPGTKPCWKLDLRSSLQKWGKLNFCLSRSVYGAPSWQTEWQRRLLFPSQRWLTGTPSPLPVSALGFHSLSSTFSQLKPLFHIPAASEGWLFLVFATFQYPRVFSLSSQFFTMKFVILNFLLKSPVWFLTPDWTCLMLPQSSPPLPGPKSWGVSQKVIWMRPHQTVSTSAQPVSLCGLSSLPRKLDPKRGTSMETNLPPKSLPMLAFPGVLRHEQIDLNLPYLVFSLAILIYKLCQNYKDSFWPLGNAELWLSLAGR